MAVQQRRFSAYRIMWIMVCFDLPTYTKKDRDVVTRFRKNLLDDGFDMFQYSIYTRHCPSRENAEVHAKRIRDMLPQYGKVTILKITDKQFGNMETYYGTIPDAKPKPSKQLTLF